MKRMFLTFALAFAIPIAAQDRFTSGDLKGFTMSPSEWLIDQISEPIKVRSVVGNVIFRGQDDPLEGVLFEIRGPGNSERIRSGTTISTGRFRISHVPARTYAFKATLAGYSSVTGTLVVSKHADRAARVQIAMKIGD